MAYGMNVLTSNGMQDLVDSRAARLHATHSITTSSGSATIAGFNSTIGFIYTSVLNLEIAWNNSTKVLSWTLPSTPSSAVIVYFYHTA